MKNKYTLLKRELVIIRIYLRLTLSLRKQVYFQLSLVLSDEHAKPIVKLYEETLKARQEKENTQKRSAHNQYKVLKDGGIEFKFKLKNKVTMRDGTDFEQRPKILNADKTIAEEQPIYSGSKMKIAFQAVSWANNLQGVGVTLRLKAVQLIEVVSEKPINNLSPNRIMIMALRQRKFPMYLMGKNKKKFRKNTTSSYRSGLEENVINNLKQRNISFKYEQRVVGYFKPATKHKYTPDIELDNGVLIEIKGFLNEKIGKNICW